MAADLLGHDADAITPAMKAEAVKRELNYRRRVYPRWVADGRMTQALADRQIKIFEEILRDYERGSV